MLSSPTFYLFAIPAVVCLGLSKGGFAGVGSIATPFLALVLPPVTAAAILLPLIIVQDVVGVWAFRHTWDRHVFAVILPSCIFGVALGWFFAARVPPSAVLGILGVMSIVFAVYRLWADWHGSLLVSAHPPDWVGVLCGIASGFTSQVAHAGGPPYQVWVLPRRLSRDSLIGTTAIIFAIVNWTKVAAYVALGQFTADNMIASATLLPVAIISTLAGVYMVRRVSVERFYVLVYALMILVGIKLLWDGVA